MPEVPFAVRAAVLVGVLAALAAWDRWRRGPAATRWREYAFLLAVGAAGGAFGVLVDQVTVTLSPEYFVVGKGLDEGPGLRWRALELGLHAGCAGGLVAGGVLLLVAGPGPGRPQASFARLGRALLLPLGAALLLAPAGAALAWAADPVGLRADLRGVIPPAAADRFVLVWGIHAGVYAGGILGTLAALFRLRRPSAPGPE